MKKDMKKSSKKCKHIFDYDSKNDVVYCAECGKEWFREDYEVDENGNYYKEYKH